MLPRLDINLTRSDFGVITGERPPDTTSNDINTTVTVPDGSTIILGGLLKLNQSKIIQKHEQQRPAKTHVCVRQGRDYKA
jgi:hypothetical protein